MIFITDVFFSVDLSCWTFQQIKYRHFLQWLSELWYFLIRIHRLVIATCFSFFFFFPSSRFLSLNFGRVALHDSELKIILIYLLPDLCAHLAHFTSLYFTSTLLIGRSSQTEGWERLRLLAHRNYTNTHWPLYLRLLPSLTLTQPNCFSNHNQSLSNELFSSPLWASSFCLETSVSVNNVTVFEESRQGKIYNKIKTWV